MSPFVITLLILCTLAAVYLSFSLIHKLSIKLPWRLLLTLPLLLCCYAFPIGMLCRENAISPCLVWLCNIAGGLACYLFLLALLKDILLLPFWRYRKCYRGIKNGIVVLSSIILSIIGYQIAYDTQVIEVEIPIPAHAAPLADLRIVQISDLHVTKATPQAWLTKIVKQTNALHPDIICITGDHADMHLPENAELMRPLAALRATYGVFFVDGNHEYILNQHHQWCEFLPSLGWAELRNSNTIIKHNSCNLMLAGVPDPLAARFAHEAPQVQDAIANDTQPQLSILLSHRPELVHDATAAGVDIQLSGHTHDGQFFPWNLLVSLAQEHMQGLYHVDNTQLYVNQGTGFWAIPNRLGTMSEITLIKLIPTN